MTVTVPIAVTCMIMFRVKLRQTSLRKNRILPQSMAYASREGEIFAVGTYVGYDAVIEAALVVREHLPVLETNHAAAHPVDDERVVRRDDDRGAFEIDAVQEVDDFVGVDRVEVSGRFVAQQNLGIIDERAGDRRALLFASRELVRKDARFVRQTDQIEDAWNLAHHVARPSAGNLERERHVFPDGLVE